MDDVNLELLEHIGSGSYASVFRSLEKTTDLEVVGLF